MKEQIIVSLTTWSKRIHNIPKVLDTIFAQTVPPDFVVLNLAFDEQIPPVVVEYIRKHTIVVNRVPDTKVYKKLIPSLIKYPNDCIISIDDDWLYPQDMISDFMEVHKSYPNNPISGNREILFNMQCHCGCASLMKFAFLGHYIDEINDEIIEKCPSDDIVYTFFANKAGFPYMRTHGLYFTNMLSYNDCNSYSNTVVFSNSNGIKETYKYLVEKYGVIESPTSLYFNDKNVFKIVNDIYQKEKVLESQNSKKQGRNEIYNTKSFKIGNALLKPLSILKKKLIPHFKLNL